MNVKEYLERFNHRRHIPARYYAYHIGTTSHAVGLSEVEARKRARLSMSPNVDSRYIREGVADAYKTQRSTQ